MMGFISALFTKKTKRPIEQQQAVNHETATMALYHFMSCPFCMKVRRVIKQLDLNIEMRNIHQSKEHFQALVNGGGDKMVPCLRIEHPDQTIEWMYESDDIVAYLKDRFC